VGKLAHVRGVRRPNGEIWATQITVVDPQADDVDFEGVIESIQPDRWQVGGTVVLVDGQTQIAGTPQTGKRAQVHGLLQPGGEVLALQIAVLDPTPTATASATATVTPSPTPPATSTPTPGI
jgi:hypothetical protein